MSAKIQRIAARVNVSAQKLNNTAFDKDTTAHRTTVRINRSERDAIPCQQQRHNARIDRCFSQNAVKIPQAVNVQRDIFYESAFAPPFRRCLQHIASIGGSIA